MQDTLNSKTEFIEIYNLLNSVYSYMKKDINIIMNNLDVIFGCYL